MSEHCAEHNLRVIGAGLGRTGTLSFKKALEILGFGPCYHAVEVSKHKHNALWTQFANNTSDLALLRRILADGEFSSSCDFPSSPYWQEQLTLYPNAKVILTARDAEKWYKSCSDTIFKMSPGHPEAPFGVTLAQWLGIVPSSVVGMLNRIIFEKTFKQNWDKHHVIACYNEHNSNVLKTCPADKLLVFEVSEGWKPLCAFLDVPVPNVPFPHVNDTKHFQGRVKMLSFLGYVGMGAALLGTTVVLVVGIEMARGAFLSEVKIGTKEAFPT